LFYYWNRNTTLFGLIVFMGPDGCSGIQASLLENISNMVGILFQTSVEVIEGSNISGRNNEPVNASGISCVVFLSDGRNHRSDKG
jgi:hypothetical protein